MDGALAEHRLMVFEDKNGDGRIQYYNDKNPEMAARRRASAGRQRSDQGRQRHHGPRQPRDRRSAELGHGAGRGRRHSGGALHRGRLLLAISSAVSHDLLKGVFMPSISAKAELLAARMPWASRSSSRAISASTRRASRRRWWRSPSGSRPPPVPTLMMGIFSKRINKEGAIVGMLVGVITTASTSSSTRAGSSSPAPTAARHARGLVPRHQPLGFGVIGALLTSRRPIWCRP
jgi:cation/acetate symporter